MTSWRQYIGRARWLVRAAGAGLAARGARRRARSSGRGAAAVLTAGVVGAGLLAGSWLAAAPASAAGQDPSCSTGQCTVTFSSPGTGQSFTVPAGVTSLEVTLYGAEGGLNSTGDVAGGDGAEVTAALAVAPAQVLGVDVGGAGQGGLHVDNAVGGVNGGGSSAGGGGGGGATDLTSAGAQLLVAGGGGGAGSSELGADCEDDFPTFGGGTGGNAGNSGGGGESAQDGSLGLGGGGGGSAGTVTAPGTGGTAGLVLTGASPCGAGVAGGETGTTGSGGTGGSEPFPDSGGGGGGGYTGGGGGGGGASEIGKAITNGELVGLTAGSGGGGGGSSYTGGTGVSGAVVTDAGNSGQVNSGSGEVLLSYADPVMTGTPAYTTPPGQALAVPASSGLLSAAAGTAAPAGDSLTASGPSGGTTTANGTVSVSADGSFSYTPPAGFTGTDSFSYTVTDASGDYATGTATIVVVTPQTVTFTTSPPSPADYGGSYVPAAAGGGSGNPVTFSIDSSSTAGACALSGTTVEFTGTGTCVIDAAQAGDSQYAAGQAQQSFTIATAAPQVVVTVTPASGATVTTDVDVSATVVGVAGGATPGGSVLFIVDGLAASCGAGGSVTLASGAASCDVGELLAGANDFTARYSGDANYSGATGTVGGYAVSLLSQPVAFTSSPPSPADYGSSYVPAATGGGSGNPVTFSASGACSLAADGSTVEFSGVGTCTVTASQAGSADYAAGQAQQPFTISPAATSTTVAVTATALTATVTAVPPGGGTPSGMVTFMVGSTTAGTADLNSSGVATLPYASSGAETVAASYAGTADYLASSGSTATTNPTITAALSSKYPESADGWYRSPVTVTFACTAGSAPLTAPCPAPVTLSGNGASQRVTRTIQDSDGGVATASVTVSIDQTAPKVTVTGIKDRAGYDAPGPAKITCRAAESISGLAAPCRLTVRRTAAAITWTATATSKAGVATTVTGKAALIDYFVAGVPERQGRFLLVIGHTYTVEAYLPGTKAAPRYVYAAPAGVRPHPVGPAMKKIGPGLWAIRATITAKMDRKYENWNLGVLVGRTLHLIPLTLER
jgi:hypothetical protein